MRRLIYKLFIICLPLGLMVCLISYLVDPAHIFSSQEFVNGIADILSKGHNIDNLGNYDERLMQEQMVKRLRSAPDVIVLGSSRVWEIGSDFFAGKTVLNCGVSGATVHDLISIVGLLDSLGKMPREFLISLDPFLVGEKLFSEWGSLHAYHHYFFRKINDFHGRDFNEELPNSNNRFLSLFSLDYFRSSLDFMIKGKSKKYYDVGSLTPAGYGRFPDGTVCYPFKYLNPDSSLTAIIAKDAGLRVGIPPPDPTKILLLETLLDFLKLKKVKVKLVLIPYHPEYYHAIENKGKQLFKFYDITFKELAKKEDIPVMGGFNADSFGIPPTGFYDMYHCSRESIRKIFEGSQKQ